MKICNIWHMHLADGSTKVLWFILTVPMEYVLAASIACKFSRLTLFHPTFHTYA